MTALSAWGVLHGQPVPRSADRLEPAGRLRIVAEFTAKIPNMHLHGPFIGVTDAGVLGVLVAPDGTDELRFRQDRSCPAKQLVKDDELASRHFQHRPINGDCPRPVDRKSVV